MIVNGTIGNGDLAGTNVINTSQIIDATIVAIDIASSVINTTHIVDATINNSDLANNSVNTTNILDATIAAIDLAANSVNTTHIVDATITNADIAIGGVNGSNIAGASVVNITALNVQGVGVLNSTNNATNMNSNITGIYFGSAFVDLGTIASGVCTTANITMSGLPVNASCLSISDASLGSTGSTLTNLTVMGSKSLVSGVCGVKVCNVGTIAAIDPPVLEYRIIAFTFAGTTS